VTGNFRCHEIGHVAHDYALLRRSVDVDVILSYSILDYTNDSV